MFIGKIWGAGTSGATNMVFREISPGYFWFSVAIAVIGGVLITWGALEHRD
ncbi:MAG: hypothetical protein GY829_11530 [Gammaproteobacteria bacterium]|nr:hypothetical protein [Gammaproteobacteria bacterium]